jgi:hypothetical protein
MREESGETIMNMRNFQPGDEAALVAIYNEAAADLPKFKAATLEEVQRRCSAPDFDAGTRLFAEEGGRLAGYATFHPNGRVSYPWCRKGQEHLAQPLFQKMIETMKQRKYPRAFAAYRGDWPAILDFFRAQGFHPAREMINFAIDLEDMPTASNRPSSQISPLKREDLPALVRMAPGALRTQSIADLERHFFANPYFRPEALFVLRSRVDAAPLAAGVLIEDPAYANPREVDPAMPCFRLGAFGTEGMQTKRINGLFSFLTGEDRDVSFLGLDLMGHAAYRLHDKDVATLAAQAPSDVPHLVRFYHRYFQRQGSFPVLERELTT